MAKQAGGWVSLHRKIQEHWIWKDANKLKWWLDIMLTVNSNPARVNIGNEIFDCDRGESLISLKGWSERWNTSKDSARNFLKLLEKDGMITCVSVGKSTRITICNYDTYQIGLHVNQTQSKRNPNAIQTQTHPNNKDNKDNKEDKRVQAQESDTFKTIAHLSISKAEYNKLLDLGFTAGQVADIFDKIENYSGNKKYKSLYLTASGWLKTEHPEVTKKSDVKKLDRVYPEDVGLGIRVPAPIDYDAIFERDRKIGILK